MNTNPQTKKQIQRSFLFEIAKNLSPFTEYVINHFPLFAKIFKFVPENSGDVIIQNWILNRINDTVETMEYDKFTAIELNFLRELYLKYKEDNNLQ